MDIAPHDNDIILTCYMYMYFFIYSELGLTPPKPEEEPPVPWWNAKCDLSLLVAIVKHGEREYSDSSMSSSNDTVLITVNRTSLSLTIQCTCTPV